MEKFNFSLDRKVVAAFILVVGTYFAFTHDVKTAQATTNASGLSAQFGCMLNRNGSGYQTKWQGSSDIGTSLVVYMDFSTNTSKGLTTFTDNFNTSSVSTKTQSFTTTFTETAVAEVNNTYKVTHTVTNSDGTPGGTATFLGILVNSGNTVLMTQVENGVSKASWSGVCQKV
jgi:secreted protein with Ig-like and vWFA domain